MKQKIVLIIAVGMGVLAFVLTKVYLTNEYNRIHEGAQKIAVVVARDNLPSGTTLTPQNTTVVEEFKTNTSSMAYTADQRQFIMGQTLKMNIRKNVPISSFHIGATINELDRLAPAIRQGMRAISIPVSGETAVSGLVRPNDKVDILGTFSFVDERNPGEMETVTFTVLQNVTVLATGQETARAEIEINSTSRRRSGYNTVTISVFPQEAELLAFAMNVKGSLTLALRNPSDVSVMEQTPPIDFQTLQQELPRLNEKRQSERGTQGQVRILER